MRRQMGQILALAEMLALPDLRSPVMHAVMLIFPLMFVYLFWRVGGMKMGQHVLFGSLLAIPMNSGIIAVPQSVLGYKHSRRQDMFVAAPVSQFVYVLGNGLARLLFSLPHMLVMASILISAGYMPLRAIPVSIAILMLCWAVGCSIGFTIAMYMSRRNAVTQFANLLALVLLMLPPVMYPIELISRNMRWLTLLIPTTSAAQLLKINSGLCSPDSPWSVVFCWLVLIASCAVFLWLAAVKAQWRER